MRKIIKAEAWKNLAGNWLKAFLIKAIQGVIFMVIFSRFPIRVPAVEEIVAVQDDAVAMLRLFMPSEITPKMLALIGVTLLLYLLVMAPLNIGICRFFLKVSKGEKPKISEAFSVYTSLKTVFASVWLSLLVVMMSAFWMFVFALIPVALVLLGSYLKSVLVINVAFTIAPLVGFFAGLWSGRYAFASYVFAEGEKGAFGSLRECISLLRGKNWECVVLGASYTIWAVISVYMPPLSFVYFALSNAVYARYLTYLRGELNFKTEAEPPTF